MKNLLFAFMLFVSIKSYGQKDTISCVIFLSDSSKIKGIIGYRVYDKYKFYSVCDTMNEYLDDKKIPLPKSFLVVGWYDNKK